MSAFLVAWVPDTAFSDVEFGSSIYNYNKIFPDTKLPNEHGYFKNLKMTPEYGKLEAIDYKCY